VKILFLDQSGKPGGAELCLIDTAKPYRDNCLVGLFADGPFTFTRAAAYPSPGSSHSADTSAQQSSFADGLGSLGRLAPIIAKVALLSRDYDLIYANTQKL